MPCPGATSTSSRTHWPRSTSARASSRAARSAREAGAARREQGAALWRPKVQFSGTLGIASNETSTAGAQFSAPGFGTSTGVDFNTSINGGKATKKVLTRVEQAKLCLHALTGNMGGTAPGMAPEGPGPVVDGVMAMRRLRIGRRAGDVKPPGDGN